MHQLIYYCIFQQVVQQGYNRFNNGADGDSKDMSIQLINQEG